jgi:hypothetical protein
VSLEATALAAHPSDLTDLERGLFAILVLAGTFLMYFGFFVCIPLRPNAQAHRRQWSVAELPSGAAPC